VPAFSKTNWSKLRPFSGSSFTSRSPTKPETEEVVVFTTGASAVTVICSVAAPTSSFRFTTAC